MSNDIIDIILNELNDKRSAKSRTALSNLDEIKRLSPKLKSIEIQIAKAALHDRASLPVLRQQYDSLLNDCLKERGLSGAFVEPQADCITCADTGFCNGKLCACVKNEAAKRMYSEAGLTNSSPSFDKFNLSLFLPGETTEDGKPLQQYMRALRDFGINYCEQFPQNTRPNLLFYGKPGRGKTFMMDCIAGSVISKGYWTIRATAFHVNDIMAKALFDKANPDNLFDCDLLLLDDLGSEPLLNKVTISSLFNLFNERSIANKPFIISTNLTKEEILKRYGDRIFSRLTDKRTTSIIRFEGIDLRQN